MLRIKKGLVEMLKEHAHRESPREACGVLAGFVRSANKPEKRSFSKTVTLVYACSNASENPETTYEIAPPELLKVIEEVEAKDLEILGFYHSHPMGLSGPSFIDEGRATWHGHSYVIVTLPEGNISSWQWREEGFEEEEVKLV